MSPHRLFRVLLSWLAGALCLVSHAGAQVALPAGMTRVTAVEGVTEYALPNGLRVLTLPDSSKPTTTVNLTIKVGSRMESYGETGMAHLLEHLLFKGTPNVPDPKKEMSARGLSWNGTTSDDRTNYFASMAENRENLDFYLGWLAEALTQSFIARKDLDSEMTVVRNEMEMGENNPGRVLFQSVRSAAYRWHNYGKSTIGARADVENVDIPRLQAFYRTYYQPDNATLIVAGKFDEAKALATIAQAFGRIPKPTRAIEPTYTLEPVQDGERSITVRRVGDTPMLLAMYHVPAGPAPDYAAIDLAASMIGGPDFRLHKALVEKGLAAAAYGDTVARAEPGFAFFGAQLKSDQSADAAREALLATVEGLAQAPFTQAELDRARNIWLRDFNQTINDPQRAGLAVSEYIAMGDWRLAFQMRDRVKAATLADVNRVGQAYLLASNRTVGSFVPTAAPRRAPALDRVDVAAVMKDFKGGAAVAAGEDFDVSPENIERRTRIATLPGAAGVRVALLPKSTRGNKVTADIALRFGDEKTLFGKSVIGSAAANMLSRGTERLTREQLSTAFENLQTTWSVTGYARGALVRLETTRENLAASVALAEEVLKKPRFDPAEFAQMKAAWVSSIEESRNDPQALVRQRVDRHGNPYPKGDPRYPLSFDETLAEVEALKLDELRAFHRDFYGASQAIVTAVGDFDAQALTAQVEKAFGGWTSRSAYTRVPQPALELPPARFAIEVKDKANAVAAGRLEFALRETDREYQALRLASQIFGSGGSSRLWQRIREKEGISYGVGAGLSGGLFDANADWNLVGITAPQNADRFRAAFDEELARARREGFSADELKRAKEAIAASVRLARAQDGGLADALVTLVERGKTPRYFGEIEALRNEATLDEVNAAFRKYVVPEKLVYGIAGDFAATRAAAPATVQTR